MHTPQPPLDARTVAAIHFYKTLMEKSVIVYLRPWQRVRKFLGLSYQYDLDRAISAEVMGHIALVHADLLSTTIHNLILKEKEHHDGKHSQSPV